MNRYAIVNYSKTIIGHFWFIFHKFIGACSNYEFMFTTTAPVFHALLISSIVRSLEIIFFISNNRYLTDWVTRANFRVLHRTTGYVWSWCRLCSSTPTRISNKMYWLYLLAMNQKIGEKKSFQQFVFNFLFSFICITITSIAFWEIEKNRIYSKVQYYIIISTKSISIKTLINIESEIWNTKKQIVFDWIQN